MGKFENNVNFTFFKNEAEARNFRQKYAIWFPYIYLLSSTTLCYEFTHIISQKKITKFHYFSEIPMRAKQKVNFAQ